MELTGQKHAKRGDTASRSFKRRKAIWRSGVWARVLNSLHLFLTVLFLSSKQVSLLAMLTRAIFFASVFHKHNKKNLDANTKQIITEKLLISINNQY
jgi:hypothetical protein